MRISKNINLVPIFEVADENFSVIEFSRRKMFNSQVSGMSAEVYTMCICGLGLRVFVEKRIEIPYKMVDEKVENNNLEINNKKMVIEQKTNEPKKVEEIGVGIIRLQSKKVGPDTFTTSSTYDFKNLNTEGTILELKKIIKKLEKDL